jgi:hypothetical protein
MPGGPVIDKRLNNYDTIIYESIPNRHNRKSCPGLKPRAKEFELATVKTNGLCMIHNVAENDVRGAGDEDNNEGDDLPGEERHHESMNGSPIGGCHMVRKAIL